MPTETLYAWPFNLSSPNSKGVCYETYSASKVNGEPRRPPEETTSISLRVLADVIRCWMKIRRERAALAKCRGSDNTSGTSITNSPTSSVDNIVDNDEVIDEIIDALDLHPLAPLERSIHVLRQVLPEQPQSPTLTDNARSPGQRGGIYSSQSSNSDRDSHHRSDSSASSRASTVDPSPEDLPTRKSSSPKLPKIITALPLTSASNQSPPPVPQICLVEATPQEAEYEERDRALEKARPTSSRNGSFNGRGMDTVHEDSTEDNDTCDSALNEATPTYDSEEVTFIKIHPCDRQQTEQGPESPKTATPVATKPEEGPTSKKSKRPLSSPPSKISFRDPFRSVERSSSKPDIRVETIEYGSPDSLLASSNKDTAGTQPLSVGDDRLASDNNFADQSSAHPNPSNPDYQQVEKGETIDQGGYGLSASGGDQFAKENQTGQGFSSTQDTSGQFKPSIQDSTGNINYRADAPSDTDNVTHRGPDM
ncbi:hypothetical protein NDA16_001804 [Ustilago loliicola]|nr:hypothetical protein NDA16_001804 [Ustilago loliicola]